MRQYTKKQIIWCLGLEGTQTDSIRDMAGPEYALQIWPAGSLPDFSNVAEMHMPCLICFSLESCRQFLDFPPDVTGFLELTPKALLLGETPSKEELEEALDLGASDILRAPLTRSRFSICLRKASEAAALQRDIQNMAREVFIEREMLEHKNEALSFLVSFLTQTSESLNDAELLEKSFTCLQQLFQVRTLHAALCTKDDNGNVSADLFIAAPKDSPAHGAWRERLLDAVHCMTGDNVATLKTRPLSLTRTASVTALPTDGHIITLPMHVNDNFQFFLMLLTTMERNLSRDQAMALDSALRHMALSLKNARSYQEMCHFADRDALTGAYNRRYFEGALNTEVVRHQRYQEELSLLILDIDHFKKINDTWGHLKGDEVLRSVAATITATIRQTDYCVRYGGEEFVVMLPHTSNRNATWLAERLRRKIQKLAFSSGKSRFGVSISAGVASVLAGEGKDGTSLVHEADKALYQAKNDGRNKVVTYSPDQVAIASC